MTFFPRFLVRLSCQMYLKIVRFGKVLTSFSRKKLDFRCAVWLGIMRDARNSHSHKKSSLRCPCSCSEDIAIDLRVIAVSHNPVVLINHIPETLRQIDIRQRSRFKEHRCYLVRCVTGDTATYSSDEVVMIRVV